MQINTSSKMYICIHATTITTGEKKPTNNTASIKFRTLLINFNQSINPKKFTFFLFQSNSQYSFLQSLGYHTLDEEISFNEFCS